MFDQKRNLLTREQLYEKVWSSPVQILAKEFGISDVGLAKICRRYRIPVPGRGYWAQLQAGQTPPRQVLPTLTERVPLQIEITGREKPSVFSAEGGDPELLEKARLLIVTVNDEPPSHPFVLRAEKLLHHAKPNDRLILTPKVAGPVPLRVSLTSLPRALKILEAILQAAETLGLPVEWKKTEAEGPSIEVLSEKLKFSIAELFDGKPHVPAAKEKAEKERYSWTTIPERDYIPNGGLALTNRQCFLSECASHLERRETAEAGAVPHLVHGGSGNRCSCEKME
jgi:hypothetical protein